MAKEQIRTILKYATDKGYLERPLRGVKIIFDHRLGTG